MWQNLWFGVRILLKRPLFTFIAVLTLALGIGANSLIFSVVNAVLLRPLPYRDSARLVFVSQFDAQRGIPLSHDTSFPRFTYLREQSHEFENLAAVAEENVNLTGRDVPEQMLGAKVSGDLFGVLGVKPFIGRTFLPEEDQPGGAQVAVISYSLWRRLFGTDTNILGQGIELDGQIVTIVGVLPADFKFLDEKQEVWLPRAFEVGYLAPESIRLGATYVRVIARLKEDNLEQVSSHLETIMAGYKQGNPDNGDTSASLRLTPLQESMVTDVRKPLLVVLGMVGLVLLIACVNVTNLLLARAAARRREFALRTALGATRLDLIRQLLTESVLLSLLGGAGGILIAYCGIKILVAVRPTSIPRLDEITLDFQVLAFTLLIAVLTGVIFGLAPALQSSETALHETLKEGSRTGTDDPRGHRVRRGLVVLEIALALLVLIDAGLLIDSFLRLRSNRPGLSYENVLTLSVTLPRQRYVETSQQANFYKQAIERIRNLPGVTNVAAVSVIPLTGPGTRARVYIEGVPDPGPGKVPVISGRFISPDYFAMLNIPLLAGRPFTERDDGEAPNVAIVNESFARRFWPDEEPIGKRFAYTTSRVLCEVVGVVADTKFKVSDIGTPEEMYQPYLQRPRPSMSLLVRTAIEPLTLASAAQTQILSIDKDQPVGNVETMQQVVRDSIEQPRMTMLLLSVFALIALILSMIGVYGVMTYSVIQRTQEFGVRIALGAQPRNILALVIRQGMVLTLAGISIGLVAAFASTRVLSSVLFETSATNPVVFAGISLLLGTTAFLACYIPARKATKIEPITALNNA